MAKRELLSDAEREQLLGIPTERDDLARLYTFEPTDIDLIRLRRETDIDGGISRVGDAMARTALYEAAHIMLTRATRFSALKRWAMDVAKRRGMKRAKVALARKLATVLHRMWADVSQFR